MSVNNGALQEGDSISSAWSMLIQRMSLLSHSSYLVGSALLVIKIHNDIENSEKFG